MKFNHLRNATALIEYAGKTFLIDPMLSEKGALPPMGEGGVPAPAPRMDQRNPLQELPVSVEDVVSKADAVIVTHLHPDHWDAAAVEALPKDIAVFTQNDEDKNVVAEAGFTNVTPLSNDTAFEGISLIKTQGEHGRGEILQAAGLVCGVVFKHEDEKTLYLAGDTVWYDGVEEEIKSHNPDVIVVNAGDNQFLVGGSLVMKEDDVLEVSKAAPEADIVAVHMEAVNHWNLSKADLKAYAEDKGFSDKLTVPENGDTLEF
ncbi:MBL fold metallo-hydrolase [Salinicoccus sp. ID82-1]|uniref:MBL fold metallo-hydrolase n=1 Tax=Salinicoccus cyprini TaxID=2493691 RepID=A0A558AQZ5_9STAP|nr:MULTISPECIES: MBL fold metallo-hydrolase [Salinicoccus]MCG1010280.1 MBL fold metallo-hydrolase [Salinicoccus sp. ID82-1]TVT26666.1 MBL fold metallo-hydrolase [Salinicoccus cyprini]